MDYQESNKRTISYPKKKNKKRHHHQYLETDELTPNFF